MGKDVSRLRSRSQTRSEGESGPSEQHARRWGHKVKQERIEEDERSRNVKGRQKQKKLIEILMQTLKEPEVATKNMMMMILGG